MSIGLSVNETNGASPSCFTGRPKKRWCIAVLPTSTTSSISLALKPLVSASSPIVLLICSMTTLCIFCRFSALCMAKLILLITSSPKLICGFITPFLSIVFPESRSTSRTAILVVPRSIAAPKFLSALSPPSIRIISPLRTETVAFQEFSLNTVGIS